MTEPLLETIVQRGAQFCVLSRDGKRSFGCYPTREEAEKRLAQIERFKKEVLTEAWEAGQIEDGLRFMEKFPTGDPGLFRACMADSEMQSRYPDDERRARVCAAIHQKITGEMPAEHESAQQEAAAPAAATRMKEALEAMHRLGQLDVDGAIKVLGRLSAGIAALGEPPELQALRDLRDDLSLSTSMLYAYALDIPQELTGLIKLAEAHLSFVGPMLDSLLVDPSMADKAEIDKLAGHVAQAITQLEAIPQELLQKAYAKNPATKKLRESIGGMIRSILESARDKQGKEFDAVANELTETYLSILARLSAAEARLKSRDKETTTAPTPVKLSEQRPDGVVVNVNVERISGAKP